MPHTLLLADESVTIQRVIELTFADEDVQVFAVSDGVQAIARIEASPPDIVLADIGMPGKSGYEVAQHIKHSPRLAHIPVILLTGAFEPVDEARAAGCEGVLAKPFEPQLVIGRVRELLAGGSRSAAPATVSPAATSAQQPEPPVPAANDGYVFSPPPADEAPVVSTAQPLPADLDSYFDRLDEAFAGLDAPAHETAVNPAPPTDSAAAERSDLDLDWFGPVQTPAAKAVDTAAERPVSTLPAHDAGYAEAPLSYASPLTEFERLDGRPPAAPEAGTAFTEPASAVPPANSPLEPVVSAHVEPPPAPESHAEIAKPPAAAPVVARPATVAAPAASGLPTLADAFAALLAAEQHETSEGATAWPSAPPDSDQQVEEIVQRVLGRMSDRVVRETVSGLVSAIAERMIREEIERIKGAIR